MKAHPLSFAALALSLLLTGCPPCQNIPPLPPLGAYTITTQPELNAEILSVVVTDEPEYRAMTVTFLDEDGETQWVKYRILED